MPFLSLSEKLVGTLTLIFTCAFSFVHPSTIFFFFYSLRVFCCCCYCPSFLEYTVSPGITMCLYPGASFATPRHSRHVGRVSRSSSTGYRILVSFIILSHKHEDAFQRDRVARVPLKPAREFLLFLIAPQAIPRSQFVPTHASPTRERNRTPVGSPNRVAGSCSFSAIAQQGELPNSDIVGEAF